MRTEVVAVGSELLNGDLADTHTARFGRLLRGLGLGLHAGQVVPDDLSSLVDALRTAAERSDLVLVTGGLGTTGDDLTMDAASAMTGRPLVEDSATLHRIQARYEAMARPFLAAHAKQALVPEGAVALPNRAGSAPAVRLNHANATLFFFPGVPRELDVLIEDHLRPWLDEHAPTRPRQSHTFYCYGKSESGTAALLDDLEPDSRLTVAYRASFPRIQVTLHVEDDTPETGRALLTQASAAVRERLGPLVYSERTDRTFPHAVADAVAAHPMRPTIAVAESCTGGLIAKMLTDVPGASAWFLEGVVTYSNEAKTRHLGVPAELIDAEGAVSEPVARAMAEGVRRSSGADVGIATTGIAGPGGGSPAKPVGTVHLALATANATQHRLLRLPFDRERNRIVSAWAALELLRRWSHDG